MHRRKFARWLQAHHRLSRNLLGKLTPMKGFNTTELVADGLLAVAFPILQRPPVKPTDAPTEELVKWGIRMYVYSAAAQVRKVLQGLMLVAKDENVPSSYILGRHIFEWAAHACYMSRNLKNYVERQEWG